MVWIHSRGLVSLTCRTEEYCTVEFCSHRHVAKSWPVPQITSGALIVKIQGAIAVIFSAEKREGKKTRLEKGIEEKGAEKHSFLGPRLPGYHS